MSVSFLRVFKMPPDMRVSMAARIWTLGAGFLLVLLISRIHGVAAVGQYGSVAAMLAFTAVISLGGAELRGLSALQRGFPKADREQEFAVGLLRLTGGSAFIVLMFFVSRTLSSTRSLTDPMGAHIEWLFPILVVINALRTYLYEMLRASGDINRYNLAVAVLPLAGLAGLATYPVLFGGGTFAWILFFSETIGLLLVTIMLTLTHRMLRPRFTDMAHAKQGLRSLRPYFVTTLSTAIEQLDVLILSFFASASQVGTYVIVRALAMLVSLPRVTGSIGFAPRIAGIHQTEGSIATIHAARSQTRTISSLALITAVPLVAAGPWAIGVYGITSASAYAAMLALVAAELARSFAGQVGLVLMMSGYHRSQQWVFSTAAAATVFGIAALTPPLGALGGGVAVLIGATLRALLGEHAVRRRLGGGISVMAAFSRKNRQSST